ncbi:hypothetical protein TNCV_475331 [Trichonephila clavipes]|nr:hypothetical protein TNCV_475331 [Trichonephila clavipes]
MNVLPKEDFLYCSALFKTSPMALEYHNMRLTELLKNLLNLEKSRIELFIHLAYRGRFQRAEDGHMSQQSGVHRNTSSIQSRNCLCNHNTSNSSDGSVGGRANGERFGDRCGHITIRTSGWVMPYQANHVQEHRNSPESIHEPKCIITHSLSFTVFSS